MLNWTVLCLARPWGNPAACERKTKRMAIWFKEVSHAIDSVVDNAEIVALYRRWHAHREACGGIPPAEAFSVSGPLAEYAPRLVSLQAVGDDFIYRHYGAEIRHHSEVDMTGQTVSEFGGELGRYFLECHRRAATSGLPLYTVHVSGRTKTVFTWERLILPLKDDTGTIWLIAYNRPLESRAQLLEATLNTASDALLALRPLRDESGQQIDWMVTVANERFAQLAGASIDYLSGHLLRDVLPQWPALGFEDDCRAVVGTTHGHQRDIELDVGDTTRWFSVFIGPLLDGCVVRLSDITVVKQNEAALRANALRLQSDNAQLRQLAWLDGLTGLSNRRALDVILEREMARARRNGTPLTLAMCDIDHFKAYNDFYGHLAGDDCIREVAQVLAGTGARAADLVARYGGEEFVLVMPDTTMEGGMEVVRRAQQALHDRALPDATSPKDKLLTLSFGLAQFEPAKDEDGVSLLGRADAALYRAKHLGRNRIATQELA